MAKKKPTLSGPAGLMLEAFRFGFGWAERTVANFFKILPSISRFLKKLNSGLDRETSTRWGWVIPNYLKIIFVILLLILIGKYIIFLFLLYLILKSI